MYIVFIYLIHLFQNSADTVKHSRVSGQCSYTIHSCLKYSQGIFVMTSDVFISAILWLFYYSVNVNTANIVWFMLIVMCKYRTKFLGQMKYCLVKSKANLVHLHAWSCILTVVLRSLIKSPTHPNVLISQDYTMFYL